MGTLRMMKYEALSGWIDIICKITVCYIDTNSCTIHIHFMRGVIHTFLKTVTMHHTTHWNLYITAALFLSQGNQQQQ